MHVCFQLQYPLVNLTSTFLCDATGIRPEVVNGKALVVMRGVCNFSRKGVVAQRLGAAVLLLASNTTLVRQLPVLLSKHKLLLHFIKKLLYKLT